MRCRFELHKRVPDSDEATLLHAFEEDCPPEDVQWRAKVVLRTMALSDRQDIVTVKGEDGRELYYQRIA